MTTLSFSRPVEAPESAGIAPFYTRPGIVKTKGDGEPGFSFESFFAAVIRVLKSWIMPMEECGE